MGSAARMRDVFIEELARQMGEDASIFFVSADFGSPKLDALVATYPDRFLNVGIAEQNMVNISTGLALEGHKVFAYAIAPFITMRCYEQVRVNLALLSQLRNMNVNLLGVGAGFSYDVSGPSHQALEDISIMRTLPNIEILSPADCVCAKALVDYSIVAGNPKYVRMDGKPLPNIYEQGSVPEPGTGFGTLREGEDICLVSTGYMTHKALSASDLLLKDGIRTGVIDLFNLSGPDMDALASALEPYNTVISMEEAFVGRGGLDCLLLNLANDRSLSTRVVAMGLDDRYGFDMGGRESLLRSRGLDTESIARKTRECLGTRK